MADSNHKVNSQIRIVKWKQTARGDFFFYQLYKKVDFAKKSITQGPEAIYLRKEYLIEFT